MKTCSFCLENIHEFAEACRHCGHWQPNDSEINDAHEKILTKLAKQDMTSRGWMIFWGIAMIAMLLIYLNDNLGMHSEWIPKFMVAMVLILFFLRWLYKRKTVNKHRAMIYFKYPVAIDFLIQQRLKERQIKKFYYPRVTLLVLGILVLLTLSNPSTQEFYEYYKNKTNAIVLPGTIQKINLVVFSVYRTSEMTYYGVLGNFF